MITISSQLSRAALAGFWLALLALLACGCGLSQNERVQAVYLSRAAGLLPESELQAHPEVLVASSYEDFQAAAQSKIGLWVDKNAVDLLAADPEWLHQPPQKYYPLILVGYNSPLYAFREVLDGFGIQGPYVDWSQEALEPGFSVWMISGEEGGVQSVFRGYEEVPTVERLLEVTNELLPQSLTE